MKDESKENKLKAIKSELNQKVEAIMGPTPENANTAEGDTPERYKVADSAEKKSPTPKQEPAKKAVAATKLPGAPLLNDAQQVNQGDDKPEIPPEATIAEAMESSEQVEPPADKELDEAVDDIAAKESDEVLAAEDAVEKAFEPEESKKPGKLKRLLGSKKFRRAVFALLIVSIGVLAAVPKVRYAALNMAGVRSSASLSVLDESSRQPLKNVTVKIGDQSATTDDLGKATLSNLKLGDTTLTIERRAFATLTRKATLGWGSNPLGDVQLKPTGLQYSFVVTDFLSSKPIAKAEATSGDASAFANKEGKVLLTLDAKADEKVEITISASGYRNAKVTDDGTSKDTPKTIKLVPDKKQVFVSKRTGTYDVYSIDADASHEKLVLAGSGLENASTSLTPHPTANMAALVSIRDNKRTSDGSPIYTLTTIDLDKNTTTAVTTSASIQVIGWVGNSLVYVRIDGSGDNQTQTIASYDYISTVGTKIAASRYFNSVLISGDKVYYAPSSTEAYSSDAKKQPSDLSDPGLFVSDASGANKQKLMQKEVWNIFRTSHDLLSISSGKYWYEYTLGSASKPVRTSGAPTDQKTRIYVDNTSGSKSLWVDQRDGKGVLLQYDANSGKDKTLVSQSGLSYPLRWLNATTVLYRINTDQETADYVVSLNGGQPRKIIDVTNTTSLDRWNYY